ncbi:MAG: NADH-quinone oxidoreductase subunit L [Chloroflexi bacterium]|nr:NADH-quinone oxidoreductase subunit L [Chloroflexota bacterium]
MIPDIAVWLIILLPVLAFLVNGLIMRPFAKEKNARYSGYITILCIGAAWGLAIWAVASVAGEDYSHFHKKIDTEWLTIGDNFSIHITLLLDKLSAIMALVVTTCSLMIQIYSQGYMHGDNGYMRYFTWMPLFTAAMLGVTLSGNLLFTFISWELVGLCSYLLIGFWYHKPSAAAAAKKAFVVTRFADIGLVLALVGIWRCVGTFDILEMPELFREGLITGAIAASTFTWILLGIFAGAAGKSGQFPLHVWLPDAMEGPTPVSALIHSSTMVCAGVYLVARLFPLFSLNNIMPSGDDFVIVDSIVNGVVHEGHKVVSYADTAALVVAGLGGFTAIFAASMGMVMYDVKRVLAYSTLSQLGYMMLGLGALAYGASKAGEPEEFKHLLELGFAIGMFHLFTHAFFKSMLFLASGSLQHSTGTFDMRLMGGVRKHMPWTFWLFVIGSLALAGIWPLSGFWSKDGILLYSWEHAPWFFWFAMITVFMTAFYMFRAVFMTFAGEFKGGDPSGLHHAAVPAGAHGSGHGDAHGHDAGHATAHSDAHAHDEHAHHEPEKVHLHESPPVMVGPMVFLCILAIISGFAIGSFGALPFLGGHPHGYLDLFTKFELDAKHGLPLIGLLVALLGIFTAYAIYKAKWISNEAIGAIFRPIRTLWYRKYYMDELYEDIIVRKLLMGVIFKVSGLFDTYIIDGTVNGAAAFARGLGGLLRKLQSGRLQEYGLAFGFGVILILAIVLVGFYN